MEAIQSEPAEETWEPPKGRRWTARDGEQMEEEPHASGLSVNSFAK